MTISLQLRRDAQRDRVRALAAEVQADRWAQARLQGLARGGRQQLEQVVAPPLGAEQTDEGNGAAGQGFQRFAIEL